MLEEEEVLFDVSSAGKFGHAQCVFCGPRVGRTNLIFGL